MKTVRYLPGAQKALLKHRNVAARIMGKVRDYAADPLALANMTTEMKGSTAKRLRVGDFRVIFEETDEDVIVTKIGPRGSVYDE